MTDHIHITAFTQCSPCPQAKGQWKHPRDRSSQGYRDAQYWLDIARTLDRGLVDALFFADIHGVYDVYGGNMDAGVRHAVQFPGNDPTVLLPMLAQATTGLGFVVTHSTTYYPPFHTAKLFSSLDHFTGGRVGWNIVTSYLSSAYRNGMGDEPLPHDVRYDRADEFMEVVGKLWEQSWEENAVVRDRAADVHTDPARVHKIDHQGEYFSVEGPHMCEPSPQRTPFLVQAGTSPRGIRFAAQHAEAMFVTMGGGGNPRATKEAVMAETEAAGRDPDAVKLMSALCLVVGETEAEAKAKYEALREHGSPEGAFALFGGWTGIDLAPYAMTDRIEDQKSTGIESISGLLKKMAAPGGTFGDLADKVKVGGMHRVIVGTPDQVADRMEKMIEDTGIDGFNILPNIQPGGFEDLVDLVIPELQRRGRYRTAYEGETLRERFTGKGRTRLPDDHPSRRALRTGAAPVRA